MHIIRDTLE